MKHPSKFMTALLTALLVSATGGAQTATAKKTTAHKTAHKRTRKVVRRKVAAPRVSEMHTLREQLASQQAEIDALKNQVSARDQQVAAAQQTASEAQQQVASATASSAASVSQAQQNAQDLQQLKTSVTELDTKNDTLTQTVVQNQATVQDQINSPTALHYKGVTIQPVGFAAFEGVWRQRSVNSDINTPFNSIPFPSSNEGHTSELNFSGRQSRLGVSVSGNTGTVKLKAYFEGDFLSAGTTSNNNQSNSYTFRQRQFWGQVEKSGFKLTGGQMWSLVTEDKKSTDNGSEVLPATIDPQYMVGYNWTRQPGIRLQKSWGEPLTHGGFTAAVAAEQAQITNFTVSSAVSSAVPANFFFAGAGQNGGLYNAFNGNYANNVAPDVLVKFAFDGPRVHAEIGGIGRFLRDTYYPVTSATAPGYLGAVTYKYAANAVKDTKSAGGGFASIRVLPSKFFELGLQGMGGTGVGRYGSAQLADATLRPSGTLAPIKNYHGLASVVTHEGKNMDIFAYYGGEYDQRTIFSTAGSNQIGYGAYNLNDTGCYALPTISSIQSSGASNPNAGSPSASACASPTRYIQEGMIGFAYRAYNSPKYGRLQYSATYSYLQRNLWSGSVAPGQVASPRAENGMFHVGMRYYIP